MSIINNNNNNNNNDDDDDDDLPVKHIFYFLGVRGEREKKKKKECEV